MKIVFLWILGTLFVLDVLRPCQALTCSPLTVNTCTKSKYVTGQCYSGACQCIPGAVPNDYGCHKQFKPELRALGGQWNGEIKVDDFMVIGCFIKENSLTVFQNYNWYRNGERMINERSFYINEFFQTVNTTIHFQCEIDVYGHLTERSDVFSVRVLAKDEPFTIKPIVEGMVNYATVDSVIRLNCSKFAFGMGYSNVGWKMGNDSILWNDSTDYFDLRMSADKFNMSIFCIRRNHHIDEPTGQLLWSDPVHTPTSPAEDIPDIVVEGFQEYYYEGRSLNLTCAFNETTGQLSQDMVSYNWTGPNRKLVPGATSVNFFKSNITKDDSGDYSCSASYHKQAAKMSPGFPVVIDKMPNITASLIFDPPYPIEGGYQALICSVPGQNNSKVQFSWQMKTLSDNVFLSYYTDNVIQINNSKHFDYIKGYTCIVNLNDIEATAQIDRKQSVKISNVKPVALVFDGAGLSYSLRCNSKYGTQGSTFEWYLDGKKQSEMSKEITVTQKNDAITNVTCNLFFKGAASAVSDITAIPARGKLLPPEIRVTTQRQIFYLGASYQLLCFSQVDVGNFSFTWMKGSIKLASTNKTLNLPSIQESDNGNYTCSISQGQVTEYSIPFKVKVKTALEAETSVKLVYYQTVVISENVTLMCVYNKSDSPERFVWKKGKTVLSSRGMYQELKNVQIEDSGNYSCALEIGHVISQDVKPLDIVVQVPSVKAFVNGNPRHLFVGGTYHLICDSSPYRPSFNYQWKKDGIDLKENKFVHIIHKADAEDNGNYSCAMFVGGEMRPSQQPINVSLLSDGKYCKFIQDCWGHGFNRHYCVNMECECLPDYEFKGQKCVSSKAANINTLLFGQMVLISLVGKLCTKLFKAW